MILETILYSVLTTVEDLYKAVLFNRAQYVYERVVRANKIVDAPPLYENPSDEINAGTSEDEDGAVFINDGILLDAHNEDEVALVIAHELGHWVHRGREVPYAAEYWADSFGARAMKLAGYDPCRGAQILWRFGGEDSYSHPPGDKRWVDITQQCYGAANTIEGEMRW